jgi:hypothetical protein
MEEEQYGATVSQNAAPFRPKIDLSFCLVYRRKEP